MAVRKRKRQKGARVRAKDADPAPSFSTSPSDSVPSFDIPRFALRNSLLAVTGLVGIALLVRLALVRNYDYDEISHAHMAWLVSVGDKPYRDFAANHFPFFWISMFPIMHILPQSHVALILLRGLAVVLNITFLGALAMLICLELGPRQRIWAAALFGIVTVLSPVIHFLIEFRPDALANAMLFSSLLWLKLQKPDKPAVGFVIGLLIGVAALVNTKYLLFPFVLGTVTIVFNVRQKRTPRPFALAVCAGFIAALLGGMLLLDILKISLQEAWQMVVTYNSAVEKSQTFGFGLVNSLARNPVCLFYILPGLAIYGALLVQRRWRPGAFEIAAFAFLMLDLALTTRPWKQYVASWLILAAALPAPSISTLVAGLRQGTQTTIAACLLAGAVVLLGIAFRPDPTALGRITQDRAMDFALKHIPPDGYVISSFVVHPVFRRDTFFKTVFDALPDGTDGIETFMQQSATAPLRDHFTFAGYAEDLRNRPPNLIVMDAEKTDDQKKALDQFFTREMGQYALGTVPDTHLRVVIRKSDLESGNK